MGKFDSYQLNLPSQNRKGSWQIVLGLVLNTKSQIVHTPLRVFYDSVGKPDRIVLSLKSPIDFTVF